MKRVFIIHGYTGYPDKNWFPWLKDELEKITIDVVAPSMPNTLMPRLEKWLPHLQQIVGDLDEDTYLVGHSLGCPTILRFLEQLPEGKKVGGVVLVAGFAEPIRLINLNGFTEDAWHDEKIRASTNEIVLVNSDDDEHVPLDMGERMRDRFDAKLIVLHNAGHINEKSGHMTAPFVLEELKRMMRVEVE